MKISEEKKRELYDVLLGSTINIETACESVGIDYDKDNWEELVDDMELQLCDLCGCWCEQYEFVSEDNLESEYCIDCRK